MADYAGNEGYEVVYDMIDGVLGCATGSFEILSKLSKSYEKPYAQELNYDEERYREAYLYLYSPVLSFATSKVLNKFADKLEQQLAIVGKEALNVCCIGGGPATELLVLIKVLERLGILPSSVNCTVLDKYTGWQGTWDKLWARRWFMGERVADVSMAYVGCDLTKDISKEAKSAIKKADIVTIFMKYSRLPLAASILSNMKTNSTLLHMDSKCFDFDYSQTMKGRFLERLPEGFRKLSSVENEICDSRKGLLFQTYPGMKSYWRQVDYHQMAEIDVSALIFTKQADDQDLEPPTDEDKQ